jgi:hypothetical protein
MSKLMWQIQLLLIVAIIAVVGSLMHSYKRETFENSGIPVGPASSVTFDQNGVINGSISVLQPHNKIGNSYLSDDKGNIILQPDNGGNVQLQGDTTIRGNVSTFGKVSGNHLCVGNACADPTIFTKMMTPPSGQYVLNEQPVVLRNNGDLNHVLQYDSKYDGPRLDGWRSGRLGTTSSGQKESLSWDSNKVTVRNQLCVEDQCVTKDDVRRLKNPAAPTASVANQDAFEFGAGIPGKEINAGKIRYGSGWDTGALNIVGAGPTAGTRVTRVWDGLKIGQAIFRQDDDWVRITKDINNKDAYDKGLAAKNLFASDDVYVGKKLCIDGTCIDKSHLQMLTGEKSLAIKRANNNWGLGIDNFGNIFRTTNWGCSGGDGCFENLRIMKK